MGFLSTSSEFIDFVRELFQRPETEACREISAYIGGTLHNYLIVAQKYEDSGAAFVVGIDVTDRRLAEAALRDAEAKYRSIFENATEGIFQTSLDGRYLSVNPALAKIYGYDSPQELIESITNVATQLYVNPARREEFVRLFAAAPMSEA
ncbi:MAG: PAS domain S-box protein, partial [Coleofasciculaceae cyanobacterium SM2_3_26]|nr:PAS domain S-box protein [Coleofasciculaceae cyanobacterium SM2_3_26]